jgi:hypothetical protein
MPATPPVYIEQRTVAKVQPLESNKWDYCAKHEGYYPHVKECPARWQLVEPQPIGQEPGYWYYCTNPAGYYPYVKECSANGQKLFLNGGVSYVTNSENPNSCYLAQRLFDDAEWSECFSIARYR